jgi:hypothetical protein
MENPEITQSQTVTSALEFKKRSEEKKRGQVVSLPSGITVRMIQPDIAKLIRKGYLPAELVDVAINQAKTGDTTKLKAEDVKRYYDFMDKMVCASIVEPKIVEGENPGEDEVSVDDIDDRDKEYILDYNFNEGGAIDAKSFRKEEQGASGDAGHPMPEVSGQDTERLPGTERVDSPENGHSDSLPRPLHGSGQGGEPTPRSDTGTGSGSEHPGS